MGRVDLDQYMTKARRLLAEREKDREKYRLPADVVARGDQTQTRNDQVAAVVTPVLAALDGGSLTEGRIGNEVRLNALLMAIAAAAERRQLEGCPHIDAETPVFFQDCMVSLTLGAVLCPDCAGRLIPSLAGEEQEADDRCDLCDQPAVHFREIGMQCVVAKAWMNVCDDCFGWMTADRRAKR